jgi:hypothetical protein
MARTLAAVCTDLSEGLGSGGWNLEQSVEFARQLKSLGVDLMDCSSCEVVICGTAGVAARLGIKRTTLNSLVKKLGVNRPS